MLDALIVTLALLSPLWIPWLGLTLVDLWPTRKPAMPVSPTWVPDPLYTRSFEQSTRAWRDALEREALRSGVPAWRLRADANLIGRLGCKNLTPMQALGHLGYVDVCD